jgi:hypothetical protein
LLIKKKRFSVEQIIGLLKQAQVRMPVAEVIRKAGISEQTTNSSLVQDFGQATGLI